MICPNCNAKTASTKSQIGRGKVIEGCNLCLNTLIHGTELAAKNHRDYDKREFAGDLVQPGEKDFAKLYGHDLAREHGWSDDALRKWG